MQLLQSYYVHKATWLWAILKVQKGHTKVNIELIQDFDVENTTIKLQLDIGNFWRVYHVHKVLDATFIPPWNARPHATCPPAQAMIITPPV